jgi:hypothetical protein
MLAAAIGLSGCTILFQPDPGAGADASPPGGDASVPPGDGGTGDCAPRVSMVVVEASGEGLPPPPVPSLSAVIDVQPFELLLVAVSYRSVVDANQEVSAVRLEGVDLSRVCRAAGGPAEEDKYVTELWLLPGRSMAPSGTLTATFSDPTDSIVIGAVTVAGANVDPIAVSACAVSNGSSGAATSTPLEATLESDPCELVFAAATTYTDDPSSEGANFLLRRNEVVEEWNYRGTNGRWNTISAGGTVPGADGTVTLGRASGLAVGARRGLDPPRGLMPSPAPANRRATPPFWRRRRFAALTGAQARCAVPTSDSAGKLTGLRTEEHQGVRSGGVVAWHGA